MMMDSEKSTTNGKADYFSGEAGRVLRIHQVKCPNCAGVVDFTSGQAQATCQFCRHQFAVDMAHPDFDIDREVLTKYRGVALEVIVPDNVRTIGPAAFIMQDALTRIELPDGVEELQGANTFRECRSLKTIVLPDNLEKIPDCAFLGCASLQSITLPQNLKFLGRMVFDGCRSLTSIVIPPGVKTVEKDAFWNCTNLETIIYSEGTELRGNRIDGSPKLRTLIVQEPCTGEKVAEKRIIEDDMGFHSETTVWTMSSEERAELARRVAEITPPPLEEAPSVEPAKQTSAQVVKTGDLVELRCESCGGTVNITEGQTQAICPYCRHSFTVSYESPDFVIDQGVLVKYTGEDREVTVPDRVKAIGLLAFHGQSSLTKIVLPDSVTELQGGFIGCSSLETLILSNNLESIPDVAFQDCVNLKTIILPSNLRFIGNLVFNNCSSLTTIEIPPKVKFLDRMAFYNCPNLETIVLHENTELTGHFFVMCDKLSTLIILDSASGEKIAENRFVKGNDGTHSIVPVWSAGDRAAGGASSSGAEAVKPQPAQTAAAPLDTSDLGPGPLTWPRDIRCTSCGATIQVYEGQSLVDCIFCQSRFSVNVDNPDFIVDQGVLVKYIGASREVFVPNTVRTVGMLAFYQQSSLKKIVLPNSVTKLEGNFAGCYDLETLVLSDNIRTISAGTFKDCMSLTNVVLPRNLQSIEELAFSNCRSLTSVVFPPSITVIDKLVFYECVNLETIVCFKGTKLRGSAFAGCPKLSTMVILHPKDGKKVSEKRIS